MKTSQITLAYAKERLEDLLNECLASMNQDGSFKITQIDLEQNKCTVEFNVHIDEKNDSICFRGP